ncbi:MAG: hypothetical protein AT715_05895 [Thermoproteus sp. JCHS_4]|nr:MAG: hypothetical protein AT715_05895 [Thermoproteus sp. JCHS_4]
MGCRLDFSGSGNRPWAPAVPLGLLDASQMAAEPFLRQCPGPISRLSSRNSSGEKTARYEAEVDRRI